MKPHCDFEKCCWDDNVIIIRKTITLGFIDTYKMPNRRELPINSKVNNTMSNVVRNLGTYHGFSTKKASMRVYKDVESYFCQQNRNIESILAAKGYLYNK